MPDAELARNTLDAAGIPCYLDLRDVAKEDPGSYREPTQQVKLVVPGKFNMHAASVLERDIYNQEFEDQWRTHLEVLSDDELRAVSPEKAFCGLFDRIERVTRVYRDEVARRRAGE